MSCSSASLKILISSWQSANHSCSKMSERVILFSTSTQSIPSIRLRAASLADLLQMYLPLSTRSLISLGVSPLKGSYPYSIAYNTTPADQISHLIVYPSPRSTGVLFLRGSGGFLLITSGAIYAGVPQHSNISSSWSLSSFETPKSQILTLPQLSKRIFSSLMSLCAISFE